MAGSQLEKRGWLPATGRLPRHESRHYPQHLKLPIEEGHVIEKLIKRSGGPKENPFAPP